MAVVLSRSICGILLQSDRNLIQYIKPLRRLGVKVEARVQDGVRLLDDPKWNQGGLYTNFEAKCKQGEGCHLGGYGHFHSDPKKANLSTRRGHVRLGDWSTPQSDACFMLGKHCREQGPGTRGVMLDTGPLGYRSSVVCKGCWETIFNLSFFFNLNI